MDSSSEIMFSYWIGWVLLSFISAAASLFVMLFICMRAQLRRQMHNKFVVALAFPDFFFSFSCGISCSLNAAHLQYWGRDAACIWQSIYCIFGFAASIWMNVVITAELYRLARCASSRVTYHPLTTCQIFVRIGAVYSWSLLIACSIFFGWPVRAGAHRGLACLPMAYSVPSEVFFWLVFVNAMLGIPLVAISFQLYRVHRLLLRQTSVDRAATREVVVFFVRLFVVFIVLWVPTALLIWMVVWDGSVAFQWVGGSISHLQGLVSACLYLRKKDVRRELAVVGLGALCCDRADDAASPLGFAQAASPSIKAAAATAVSSVVRPASSLADTSCSALHGVHSSKDLEVGGEAPGDRSGAGASSGAAGNERNHGRRATTRGASTAELDEAKREAEAALSALAREAEAAIIAQQQVPMVVIRYADWLRAGHLPRSSEGYTVPRTAEDVVIFISHRWWRPAEMEPDDADGTKYRLICAGLRQLLSRERLEPSNVVLWVDFACVEQDDPTKQAQGINSLIAFAAQSSFVLTPVHPTPADVSAFSSATHPGQLANYGNRAWCRLESYVFLCLAEVTSRKLHCYGYGLSHGAFSPPLRPVERLRPLASTLGGAGASFTQAELPSTGELTTEADRPVIRRIEEEVRSTYVRSAVLQAKVRIDAEARAGRRRGRSFVLSGKQLSDADVPYLAEVLGSDTVAPSVHALRLDGNLLTCDGLATLGASVLCAPQMTSLRELSLSDNPRLLSSGVATLAALMPQDGFRIATLRLAGCSLSSGDGHTLAAAVPPCRPLRHLDLRRNMLDDSAVEALLAAGKQSQDSSGETILRAMLRVSLDIEGNPSISAATFSRVTVECGVHA